MRLRAKKKLKYLMYRYQKMFWYIAQAQGEIKKPLGYMNEVLLVLTYLAVKGVEFTVAQSVIGYIIILFIHPP